MFTIGITGGIGSGKTIICKAFELLNVPVYYADIEAKKITNTNPDVIKLIKSNFGNDIYNSNNELNKEMLADVVFNDLNALKKLNSIVHPAVKKDFIIWKQKQQSKYVLKEAALMYESGSYKDVDKMVTIFAPEKLRIQRIIDRDARKPGQITEIMKKQMSEEEKIKRSDYVIYNDDSQMVLPQVMKLHNIFITM